MNRNKKQRETFIDIIGGKANAIAMLIFAIVAIGGGILAMDYFDHQARANQYIAEIPMANQHITWTYAKPIGGGER